MSQSNDSDPTRQDDFARLLKSAARLQTAVPDAVLVGGTAAALHATHRLSFDHDHVVRGLQDRYDAVLDAVEALEGWAIDPNVSKPPVTIMGELDGHQAGLRNLRRSRPLDIEELELSSGHTLTIPTLRETLRIKAYLTATRRWVRDFVDTAALADRLGIEQAAGVLARIDDYYEPYRDREPVRTLVERTLADPEPRDTRTLTQLPVYKGLATTWSDWNDVAAYCRDLAVAVARVEDVHGLQ